MHCRFRTTNPRKMYSVADTSTYPPYKSFDSQIYPNLCAILLPSMSFYKYQHFITSTIIKPCHRHNPLDTQTITHHPVDAQSKNDAMHHNRRSLDTESIHIISNSHTLP